MGCASSKNVVQGIEIKDGKVKPTSAGKTKKILVSESANEVTEPKAASAKSRDSGIEEMENLNGEDDNDAFITENSDPNLITEVENERRPRTPDLCLAGQGINVNSGHDRVKSQIILKELEDQGLISGSKVNKGGAAFEVSTGPLRRLEPLAPIRLPPSRLQSQPEPRKKITKEELEKKLKAAEERRLNTLSAKKRSRVATNLIRATEFANNIENNEEDGKDDTEDEVDVNGIDNLVMNNPRKSSVSLSSFEENTWQNKIESSEIEKSSATLI